MYECKKKMFLRTLQFETDFFYLSCYIILRKQEKENTLFFFLSSNLISLYVYDIFIIIEKIDKKITTKNRTCDKSFYIPPLYVCVRHFGYIFYNKCSIIYNKINYCLNVNIYNKYKNCRNYRRKISLNHPLKRMIGSKIHL